MRWTFHPALFFGELTVKKLVLATAAAAAFCATASAQTINMGALTCAELTSMDNQSAGVVVFWMDGYISRKIGKTVVDVQGITADATKIGDYCRKNPHAKVLEFVEVASNRP